MAAVAPTVNGIGISGFFRNVLGGLTQPVTDAAGFFIKEKVGLVQFEQENTDIGLLARLGFGNGSAQKPTQSSTSDSDLILWGSIAAVGLMATVALFGGD